MIDADKVMNPQHFGSDPVDIRIGINPATPDRISHHFFFFFFQVTTQLQYSEDSEPVVDGSRNRWCAVQ